VKADTEALTPQTQAALEAERDSLSRQVIDLQRQVLEAKAAQEAQGYNQFRQQFNIPNEKEVTP
jgi:hypothetical protein